MTRNIEVLDSIHSVAERAAQFIAKEARQSVAARGRFRLAVSGGHTPWLMLRALVEEKVPWDSIDIFQVDERIAIAGHPDRNLTHLCESLLERAPITPMQFHPMPVEAPQLEAGASQYAATLRAIAGSPPVLDLVHLGLGFDGHTASLVPGDPVLDVTDVDVGLTRIYQGRRRMTLTYPMFNRSRLVLWVVTGSEKVEMLARLQAEDTSIPAGRIRADRSVILADRAAAGQQSEYSKTG